MSFLFGGDTGISSQEDLARRRALIDALTARQFSRAPQNVGDGIYALMSGIGTGMERRRLSSEQERGRSSAAEAFARALRGGEAQPAPASAPASQPAPAASGGSPLASLIQNESGGRWDAQNNVVGAGGHRGHFGRLQFGVARLQDAMNAGAIPQGTTPQQFMASPELQRAAERWHFADIDRRAAEAGLNRFVGQTVAGATVTPEGMRAVAHLGGSEGLRRFLESGGRHNPADANGTRLSDYLRRHGGAMPSASQQPPLTESPRAPVSMPTAEDMLSGDMGSPPQAQSVPRPQMNERDRLMLLRDEGTLAPGEADQLRAGLGGASPQMLAAALRPQSQAPAAAPPAPMAIGAGPPPPAPAMQRQPAPMGQSAPQQATPQGNPFANVSTQQLAELAGNSYLNDAQRAVVQSALQQRLRPPEFGFQNVQGLGLVRTDPRTGQIATVAEVPRAPIAVGRDQRLIEPGTGRVLASPENAPQFRPVTDPAERRRLGIPDTDTTPYQVDRDGKLAAIGRTQTSVTVNQQSESEFDKKLGGQQAEMFGQMLQGGTQVQSDLSDIAQLRELARTAPTGLQGAIVRAAGNMGVALGEGAGAVQAFEAIVNRLVPAQRPPGSGSMSDRDVELFKSSLPRLINQPDGNQRILDTMEGLARYKAAQFEIARDVAAGTLPRKDALERLSRLPNPLEWVRRQAPGNDAPAPSQAPTQNAPAQGFRILRVE